MERTPPPELLDPRPCPHCQQPMIPKMTQNDDEHPLHRSWWCDACQAFATPSN
jgi:hypothetical protein